MKKARKVKIGDRREEIRWNGCGNGKMYKNAG
jgi:hypothetical protein